MTEPTVPVAEAGSFMSDVSGMFSFFIDPQGAARRLPRKWFWVAPLILFSIVFVVVSLLNMPIMQQVMLNSPPPGNVNPEQFQQSMRIGLMIQKVGIWLTPLFFVIFSAISALIVLGTCSVMDLRARFLPLFNLMAGLSLFAALQAIVQTIIIHAKGDITTVAELQPAVGLDIFTGEGTNKALVGFLAFFNVFEIWQIVMAVLILAAAYRVSKGKAFIAVLPLYVIALIFKVVGAMFTPR